MKKVIVIGLAVVGGIALAPVLLVLGTIFFVPLVCAAAIILPIVAAYLVGKNSKGKESEKEK